MFLLRNKKISLNYPKYPLIDGALPNYIKVSGHLNHLTKHRGSYKTVYKTVDKIHSILEFSILSDFKMRNVIIWH